jgi:hypothetical protein
MNRLSQEIRKNGFIYKLMNRSAKKAIYAQYLNNLLIGYEVIKIRVHPPRYNGFLLRDESAREVYPSSEQWGKNGWTCMTLEKALERYNQIDYALNTEYKKL